MRARNLVLSISMALSACSANLTFIDRTTGNEYKGKTGSTVGNDGEMTAAIEGIEFAGSWIYSPSGGGYSIGSAFGTSGSASAVSTGSAVHVSAQGNGLMNMRAASGEFMRCVFNFNTMSSTGLGECLRNDGRQYDLRIKR